jgi:hypothetical protein
LARVSKVSLTAGPAQDHAEDTLGVVEFEARLDLLFERFDTVRRPRPKKRRGL